MSPGLDGVEILLKDQLVTVKKEDLLLEIYAEDQFVVPVLRGKKFGRSIDFVQNYYREIMEI